MAEWMKNEGATRRVKELLVEAGVPLEVGVLRVCTEYARKVDQRKTKHVDERGVVTLEGRGATAQRVVYGAGTEDQPVREIDCLFHVYDEFELNETLGIQLIMDVPVACKRRKDTEIFGIRDPILSVQKWTRGVFPLASDLAGSQLARQLARVETSWPAQVAGITLLKIEGGKTPKGVHVEKLLYNAGASLYDFVKFTEAGFSVSARSPKVDGLLAQLDEHVREHGYYWLSVIHRWVREHVSTDECAEYAAGVGRVYHSIRSYLPVVCFGGPIHEAVALRAGGFQLATCGSLAIGLRVPGWRQFGNWSLVQRSAEAPVVVTNPDGLLGVLETAVRWFEAQRQCLLNTDESVRRRAWLESALVQTAHEKYARQDIQDLYRSDMDITQLVEDW